LVEIDGTRHLTEYYSRNCEAGGYAGLAAKPGATTFPPACATGAGPVNRQLMPHGNPQSRLRECAGERQVIAAVVQVGRKEKVFEKQHIDRRR
jgi:hypothetical protein